MKYPDDLVSTINIANKMKLNISYKYMTFLLYYSIKERLVLRLCPTYFQSV